ncbi:Conserved_hypothetical protein [Hexamita inflata]|uniref:Uncharacterized protein n=1 Tax=Hexamita inflata TaxID=28002 RepID=A0AA86UGG9_9EUKA|nr:Conserved hypothetical protein [Hexamita inflata]
MQVLPQLNNKQYFVPHTKWNYILKQYEYNPNMPCCFDIIDTELQLYEQYEAIMHKRNFNYNKIQYVVLTKNNDDQLFNFLERFEFMKKMVNIVKYTKEMETILTTAQLPFCFLINQKQQIVYKGLISADNYIVIINYLNELKTNVPQQPVKQANATPTIENRQLGLLMSGIYSKPIISHRRSSIQLKPGEISTNLSNRSKSALLNPVDSELNKLKLEKDKTKNGMRKLEIKLKQNEKDVNEWD